eukprot:1186707-Prorocentrum_minimum.AAC.4
MLNFVLTTSLFYQSILLDRLHARTSEEQQEWARAIYTAFLDKHIDPHAKCIGMVKASTPQQLKTRLEDAVRTHWHSSPMIMKAASVVISKIFGGEAFIAVHWRFEETKCRSVNLHKPP